MSHNRDGERNTAERWDNEGGAGASTVVSSSEDKRDERRAQERSQSATDASYESSPRGEHRYPDVHQPAAARQERENRDELKRTLRGDR